MEGGSRNGACRRTRQSKPAGSGLETTTIRFPGHPQETTENSVDLAHLRYVHGYDSVDRIGQVSVEGPYMESRFDFTSSRKLAKIGRFTLSVSAVTHIFGLGYSFVEIREQSIGMDMRLWILATPVDGTLIDVSLVSQVREIRSPKRWIAGLGFLPLKLRAPIMNKFIAAMQHQDVLAGRGHLETQTLPVSPAPLSFRRRDHTL